MLGLQVLCCDVVMLCHGFLSLVVCTFLRRCELQVFALYSIRFVAKGLLEDAETYAWIGLRRRFVPDQRCR